MSVMSPPPALCNLSVHTVMKLCTLGSFSFRGELGFLNCDAICMCVMNKQFELLEFVFNSVYVDRKYNLISLTFTAGFVCVVSLWGCIRTRCGCGDCDVCTVYTPKSIVTYTRVMPKENV